MAQLQDMPRDEIVNDEDLAWSLPNGIYVEPTVLSTSPLLVRLEASQGLLKRDHTSRTIQLDSE